MSRPHIHHGVTGSLIRFGRLWLALFAVAVAAALGGGVIGHIGIAAVVDVVLAATVFVMAALLLFELAQALMLFVQGHGMAAVGRLLLAVTVLVLPAAPLLAFDIYAWLRHEPLLGASDVYDTVIGWVSVGVSGPARLISAIMEYCFKGDAYGGYFAQTKTVLETVYYALGIGAAIHALRSNTRNGMEPI